MRLPSFTLLTFVLCTVASTAVAGPSVNDLRTEYLVNPIGVDFIAPRLSWKYLDTRPGAHQYSYRIIAASTSANLVPGKADLWDSGKVDSANTVHITYGGKPLKSRAKVWWKVQSWDASGIAVPWSAPATFECGLMQQSDWKAKWIGRPDSAQTTGTGLDIAGTPWIWFPDGDPLREAPNANRYFRKIIKLPSGIRDAMIYFAVDNFCHGWVNGQDVGNSSGWLSLTATPVGSILHPGDNIVAFSAGNAGGPAGFWAMVVVTLNDGRRLRFTTGADWSTTDKEVPGWKQLAFDTTGWVPAVEILKMGQAPWNTPAAPSLPGGPAAMLRKTFTVEKAIESARLYVTARGLYRAHINGTKVGSDLLTPDWTDARKRLSYQTYDVTTLLKKGPNVVAALLGDGWYSGGLGPNLKRNNFGPSPNTLFAQLEIKLKDGSIKTIATDHTWLAAESAILRSELYAGETYDARRENCGWDAPGETLYQSAWKPVEVFDRPTVTLNAQISPAIRQTGTIRPLSITQPKKGMFIYDMGQNMVGWCRLRVKGPAGTSVRLRFVERLEPNGLIYRDNLRLADATDTYTLRGGPEEVYEPTFTYHGFRFVELTGYPGTPNLNTLTGIVFHSDIPVTTDFETGNALVNKLWRNIDWGLRGNFMSVPTDCPQRDERLGWMGDAGAIWPTAVFRRDVAAFTHKWMKDVRDAQSNGGAFSDVSPRVIDESDGAPAWGNAGVILPYTVYRQYGDLKIVQDNWSAMERWLKYIGDENPDFLWKKRRNNDFGDWVPANSETDKGLIATAFWAQDARMMAEMAKGIGKAAESSQYQTLYENIRTAFQKSYIKPDGTIGNGSQTCYVLALNMGLVPARGGAESAGAKLIADIRSRKLHLSTGFVGTPYLNPALSKTKHDSVAMRLLLNDTYPSWGYMIRNGATSMWERWNGDSGDPAMNSFNHYAYGSIGEWLCRRVGGIDQLPGDVGWKRILIHPIISAELKHARIAYQSPQGKVGVNWAIVPGSNRVRMEVVIPPGSMALVFLPTKSGVMKIDSVPFDKVFSKVIPGIPGAEAGFELKSGHYKVEFDANVTVAAK